MEDLVRYLLARLSKTSELSFGRLFDVSKQVVGQLFVHGANILVSDVVAHHSSSNACVFYFLNILIDTTLGEH